MSVEPSEVMGDVWTRWQGTVINGVYPLGRFLGCSDHSGVFLTRSAGRAAEVAIKLVPTNRALAEIQLPRWKRASGLVHPHLLRLFEFGGCQLDGLPYLYAVMEYADQTLAQLLVHRALTEDETREMLSPTLDALAFLHARNLVQGQLKPTNILVVGDQLKLASDPIRRVSEGLISTNTLSVYDPPEVRQGSNSSAGDVWALGLSLSEALTRRQPSGLGQPGDAVLAADFSPAFREVVARCLSPAAEHRPNVAALVGWVGGGSLEPAPAPQSALVIPESKTPDLRAPEPSTTEASNAEPSTPESTTLVPTTLVPTTFVPTAAEPAAPKPDAPVTKTAAPGRPAPALPQRTPARAAQDAVRRALSFAQSLKPRTLLMLLAGALAILALAWILARVSSSHRTEAPPPPAAQPAEASPPQTPGVAPPVPETRTPASAANAARATAGNSPTALREVMPEVPLGARRTIRGHIKVWVRVIVDQDGSVFAAAADRAGPSGYFQRLATEAAKKWTFAPADTPTRRIMQVRFDFTREGTTGRAVTLH